MEVPAKTLVEISNVLDYVPIASSISNGIHLVQKITRKEKKDEYDDYINEKDIARCIALIALPGIANVGALIYDKAIKPKKTSSKNALKPQQPIFLTGTTEELIVKFTVESNPLMFNQLPPMHLNDQTFMKAAVSGNFRGIFSMYPRLLPEVQAAIKITIENSVMEKEFQELFHHPETLGRLKDPEWAKRCWEKRFGPQRPQINRTNLTPEEVKLAQQMAAIAIENNPYNRAREDLRRREEKEEKFRQEVKKITKAKKSSETEISSYKTVRITATNEEEKIVLDRRIEEMMLPPPPPKEQQRWEFSFTGDDPKVEEESLIEETTFLKKGFLDSFETFFKFS